MRIFPLFIVISLLAAVQVGAQATDEQKGDGTQAAAAAAPATEAPLPPAPAGIALGKIRFPRSFLQAGKEYPRGFYRVTLAQKEGAYYFDVANLKKEALFSEMGIVKESAVRSAAVRHRLRQDMTSQGTFFRLKVIQADRVVMAYFQVAPPAAAKPPAEAQPN